LVVGSVFLSSKPVYLEKFTEIKYAIPQQGPSRLLDVFTHEKLYAKYSDIIVVSTCNPYSNFSGTIWAGGFFLPYDHLRGDFENRMQTDKIVTNVQSRSFFIKEVRDYAKTKHMPVAVVTGDQACQGQLPLAAELRSVPNVVLVPVDKLP
jgi:hypothetical protein